MKNVGKSLLVYAVGFVLVALLGMLVTSGSRYIDEHASQRDAKIALEDYLSTGRELPVGKYVSYPPTAPPPPPASPPTIS